MFYAPIWVFECISSFEVRDPNILSHHCCIYFEFENFTESLCENIEARNAEDGNVNFDEVGSKFVLKNELKPEFKYSFSSEDITLKLQDLGTSTASCITAEDIDKSVQDFVNIVEPLAIPLFKKQNSRQTKVNVFDNKSENPWYDEDCIVNHYAFMQSLNLFRECKSDKNRIKKG